MYVPYNPDLSRVEQWLRKLGLGTGTPYIPPQSRIEEWLYFLVLNGLPVTQELIESIADPYDESKTYTDGDYAMFDGVLKKCVDGEWNAVKITDELGSSGASSWEDLENKPFETIGEGLNVNELGELFVTVAAALWGNISGNITAQTDLMALFNAINVLIPTQASALNQLADKEFVNSTAASQASHYIYKTNSQGEKVPFDSLAELEAYTGTVTPNDYANVITTDSAGNTYYDRYTAVETESGISWSLAFRINNSSLTAVQWAALNSGITAAIVTLAQNAVQGTKINGVSVVDENGIAQIPVGADGDLGVVKIQGSGLNINPSTGAVSISAASNSTIENKSSAYQPIVPTNLDKAVMEGLGNNSLTWSDAYKASARAIIGAAASGDVLSKTSFSCLMADGTTKTLTLNGTLV